MIERKGAKSGSDKKKSFFILKCFFILLFVFLIGLVCVFFVMDIFSQKSFICGDNTTNGNCSINKPYFCVNGTLLEDAFVCGCPEILNEEKGLCVSDYHKDPKNIQLKYILRGENKSLDFVVYGGMVEYFSTLSKVIYYQEGESPSRRDFKIKNINEELQREFLLPLVVKIQNLAKNKEDQVRIAVSLVQNIPYGKSNGFFNFGSNKLNSSRYPYEVLWDLKGVCEEKSELMAFLLKEFGYGVVLFYYPVENHEAVGIKCPLEHSLNGTGYCFIESTGLSIISDNERHYWDLGRLSPDPEMFVISEGDTLSKNMEEYGDADTLTKFIKIIEESGGLNVFQHEKFVDLKEKYGLKNL